jgi:hypothetical protein
MPVVIGYGFRIRSWGQYELQTMNVPECGGWVPEDKRFGCKTVGCLNAIYDENALI